MVRKAEVMKAILITVLLAFGMASCVHGLTEVALDQMEPPLGYFCSTDTECYNLCMDLELKDCE